ncbi:MAG TPA: quinone oxidoreductase [Sphingopyxis sp.]|nr:quinone oxidoreductase [Sphingopyxis sp.]
MQAVSAFIRAPGGPDVIEWQDILLPEPQSGEIRIRHEAIGVNYLDTYHRDGTYPIDLPGKLGVEAAGVVEKIGPDVQGFQLGDRVATFGPARGAYASASLVSARSLFKLPDPISSEVAAASLLKACTVEALVERCAKVESGWPVLVHAAAGGVGLILVQWLKAIGAIVIGTVSTPEKAAAAQAAGCDHIIRYQNENVAHKVREITDGKGVRVVFDGIGMATWDISLKSLTPRGLLVNFGNAGGSVSGVNLAALAAHGSLFVTRPTVFDYYANSEDRSAGAVRIFDMISSGKIHITIGQRYALADAAKAHVDLEAGRTSGSSILLP